MTIKLQEVKNWPAWPEFARFKETNSGFIYDVQVFEDGVIIKQVMNDSIPELLTVEQFEQRFDELHAREDGYRREGR